MCTYNFSLPIFYKELLKMHFSIPDTQEFYNDTTGSNYTGFNIHINGSFHCCLRYKQLHSLHEQIKRSFSSAPNVTLPPFPPKKLLPLTNNQVEQRRASLEHYIQIVGQDPIISKSELLRTFLLSAQQESACIDTRETTLDIYLLNGYRIPVNCYTNEYSFKVLSKLCQHIELSCSYIHFFSLFLMRKDNDGVITLTRKLMDFESPYISQRMSEECQIIVRKSYWDPCYDIQLMQDKIALNLLYIQTISDIERDWIIVNPDVKRDLRNLQERGNKKEYLEIARNLPSYGCLQFTNAIVDYPDSNNIAIITIGNRELSLRSHSSHKIQETKFRVTRMRCWRVTTIHNQEENPSSLEGQVHNLELSFEYLMSKNSLKWITIASDQAMLMSVCLQSIVDELIHQKDGKQYIYKFETTPYQPISYINRDGSSRNHACDSSGSGALSNLNNDIDLPLQSQSNFLSIRNKFKNKMSTTVLFRNGRESVHNEAFEGIGDDDL